MGLFEQYRCLLDRACSNLCLCTAMNPSRVSDTRWTSDLSKVTARIVDVTDRIHAPWDEL